MCLSVPNAQDYNDYVEGIHQKLSGGGDPEPMDVGQVSMAPYSVVRIIAMLLIINNTILSKFFY